MSLSRFSARVSQCRSLPWRSKRGGPIARVFCYRIRVSVPVNLAFLDEFRRRGFIEGQNLAIEWRAYWQHFDLISQYAGELVKAGVDVIVAGGDEAIRASQRATKTIPIVALTDDMLLSGFVNSVARPDGNTRRQYPRERG